jgi:hypothetical protein
MDHSESTTHDINPSEKDDVADDNELQVDSEISNMVKEVENENGLDDNCIQPNVDIGATTIVEIAIEENVNDGIDADNDSIQPNADIGGTTVEVAIEEHVTGKDDDAVDRNERNEEDSAMEVAIEACVTGEHNDAVNRNERHEEENAEGMLQ